MKKDEIIVCFVILHYKTFEDTRECIESIRCLPDKAEIVVVDNNSDNGSYEKLLSEYEGRKGIHFIHNEKNLGFANGNNVGFQYAKNILKSDFIAVINNDTLIDTNDIIGQIISSFNECGYGVMGPDIVSLKDSGHQNPMIKCTADTKIIRKRIIRFRLLRLINRTVFYDLLSGKNCDKKILSNNNTIEQRDVQLHGSFVVYSPVFIAQEEKAFCDKTFLYCEEVILYYYCKRKNYATFYNPNIRVYHKEDSSTKAAHTANKDKRRFIFDNMINSYNVLIGFLNGKVEW